MRSAAFGVLRVVAWLFGGAVALAAILVGRLALGPIDLAPLTPYLEAALHDPQDRFAISIGATTLALNAERGAVSIAAREVRAVAADGAVIAAVPELGIGLSGLALLRGQLAPTRFEVRRPRLRVMRSETGAFSFDIADESPATDQNPAAEQNPAADQAVGTSLTAGLFDALRRPPESGTPLGLLAEVRVVAAEMTVDDRQLGLSWRMPRADLTLRRDVDGIDGAGHLSVRLGETTTTVDGTVHYHSAAATTAVDLRFHGVAPSALAVLSAELAPAKRLAVPLDGRLTVRLDRTFAPTRAEFRLSGGAGTLALPAQFGGDLAVRSLAVAGGLDFTARRLEVATFDAQFARPGLALRGHGSLAEASGGVAGGFHLETAVGSRRPIFDLELAAKDGARPATAALTLRDVEPAQWAALAPVLSPLAPAAFPVSGRVEAELGDGFAVASVKFDLSATPGFLVLPSLYPQPVKLQEVLLRGAVAQPGAAVPDRLVLDEFTVDFGGPRLTASGTVAKDGERLALTGGITAQDVAIDRLPALWPKPVGRNARDWITANLSHGMVETAWLKVVGSAPLADPGEILASTLDGGLTVRDVTAHYFGALPPATAISGRATTDGRSFILKTTGGRIGDLVLLPGRIEVSKLDTPQEYIDIDVPVNGPLSTALAVIDAPPLGYARKFHIDPARTDGSAVSRVHFYFPLIKRLEVEDIEVSASSTIKGAVIPDILPGLSVSAGDAKLELDRKGMTIAGRARLNGLPAGVEWREAFADDAPISTRIAVQGRPEAAELERFGLVLAPYVTGTIGADAVFTIDRARTNAIVANLNFDKSELRLPELDWRKPPGAAATGRISARFLTGKSVVVNDFALKGSGFDAAGNAVLAPAGKELQRIQLSRLVLGESDVQVEAKPLDGQGGGMALSVYGARFDARPFLKKRDRTAGKPPEAETPGPPLRVSLQVDRLITGDDGRALRQVLADLRRGAGGWNYAEVAGRVGNGSARMSLSYRPEGGSNRLRLVGDDLGALLRAVDVTDSVEGGQFSLTGSGDLGAPRQTLAGRLEAGDYRLVRAPIMARLLNALSVTGLIELLSGEGISFSRLVGDFRLSGDTLDLSQVATSGAALGLTMDGRVDLARDSLDVEGTIVPVYGFNRIIGMIPLIGDLLSGGAGQGIFAAAYYVSGPLSDPGVSVNPLSMLAPGFLRNLFFLGGTADGVPEAGRSKALGAAAGEDTKDGGAAATPQQNRP